MDKMQDIDIWEDAWIPNLPNGKLSTPQPLDFPFSRVEDLIKLDHKQWNLEKIQDYITTKGQEVILAIPLSYHNIKDSPIWKPNNLEKNLVEKTYKILVADKMEHNSMANPNDGLWHLKIPLKQTLPMERMQKKFSQLKKG